MSREPNDARQPVPVATLIARDGMFAVDAATGEPIIRERACGCGRRFTQRCLSPRFMEIAEGKSAHAVKLVMQQIPDLFVPVHCPSCESRDLGRQSRLDEANRFSGATPPTTTEGWTDRQAAD